MYGCGQEKYYECKWFIQSPRGGYDKTIPALFNHTKYFIEQAEMALSKDIHKFKIMNASVDIHPKTINLKSRGRWITAWIEIPGYDASKINISTIYLNGIIPAENEQRDFINSALPAIREKAQQHDLTFVTWYELADETWQWTFPIEWYFGICHDDLKPKLGYEDLKQQFSEWRHEI